MALLGLSAILSALLDHTEIIRTVGGTALILMAIHSTYKIMRERESPSAASIPGENSKNLIVIFSSAYGLTITNPMTILVFMAIFTGLSSDKVDESKWIVARGIFLRSLG